MEAAFSAAPTRPCRSAGGVAIASSPGSGGANATRVGCKPGPVPTPVTRKPARIIHLGDALLRRSSTLTRMLTNAFRRRFRAGRPQQHPYSSLLREGLAPPPVTRLSRVGSYPTISTLPVPPRRRPLTGACGSSAIGGVVSVALSLGSPRVAVNDLPALWSPDFPPVDGLMSTGDPPTTSRAVRLPDPSGNHAGIPEVSDKPN